MRFAPAQPSDMLLNIVATFLMPLFLGPASGNSDSALARAAAMEALESCGIRDVIELITCAQFLAFSLASLGSICLSMADDLSLSMLLRLRGNANACSRTALQHRRALDEGRQKPKPAPAMDRQALTVTPELATEAAALMADVAKPRRAAPDPELQARFERAERWAAQRAAMGTEPAEPAPATPAPIDAPAAHAPANQALPPAVTPVQAPTRFGAAVATSRSADAGHADRTISPVRQRPAGVPWDMTVGRAAERRAPPPDAPTPEPMAPLTLSGDARSPHPSASKAGRVP